MRGSLPRFARDSAPHGTQDSSRHARPHERLEQDSLERRATGYDPEASRDEMTSSRGVMASRDHGDGGGGGVGGVGGGGHAAGVGDVGVEGKQLPIEAAHSSRQACTLDPVPWTLNPEP